tara:strand:- start:12018 stop:12887 length:870 start_codon:yes stop_codon:yes gene_type:complete
LPGHNYNPYGTIINKDIFELQIKYLSKNYHIVTLDDLFNKKKLDTRKNYTNIAITFDDGYCDNYTYAYPILKKMGLSATFFLPTDFIGKKIPIWDWQLAKMLNNNDNNVIVENEKNNSIVINRKDFNHRNNDFIWNLSKYLKYLVPEKRDYIMKSIARQLGHSESSLFEDQDRCLNWNEIHEMKKNNMQFGSHGCSHTSFKKLESKFLKKELETSKNIIENELGSVCKYIALPFGSGDDYDQDTIENVKKVGFEKCFLNIHGYNKFNSDPYLMKRIIMNNEKKYKLILG